MEVRPYLFFDGRCEEAIEFYRKAVGAEVEALMRFNEAPDKEMCPAGAGDKVMHACFKIGDTSVMASDGMNKGQPNFDGFALSLNAKELLDDAERLFSALSKGGKVQMPLAETFFSPRFGMVADQFGVNWMVVVPQQ